MAKLLKKSYEKNAKKGTSLNGMISLEEQVMDLNQKLIDQEKLLRSKEKKLQKK